MRGNGATTTHKKQARTTHLERIVAAGGRDRPHAAALPQPQPRPAAASTPAPAAAAGPGGAVEVAAFGGVIRGETGEGDGVAQPLVDRDLAHNCV